jgi:phenylalanyl-tRNA synthetase beta chain
MKIPYGWVREYVELDLTAEQAADRLVNAGIEVASVTPTAPDLAGVVVGEIEAIERDLGEYHAPASRRQVAPADPSHRLFVCRVSTGRERFSVVCGAPNARVGARAAFAPPGARLPGGRAIAAAKIRGAESQGMLCSERELGLGDEHEAGLLLLGPDAPVGRDLVQVLGLDDHVLEVEITPNRPDCLSVIGIARELAGLTGARFVAPAFKVAESDEPVETLARVRIEAPDLCRRFTGRVIGGLTVAPSPAWLAARLRMVGLRPISNVVDITNYVMWEVGHPLHAFDHGTVGDATIVVRRAKPGERITTLDGQERRLEPTMLLIADPRRGLGIAGVMGGRDSEVSAATTRVLLEAAYFDPASVRRTSRTLGLRTDAAYRFERGADIEALVDASTRAAQLMSEVAGGVVARGLLDAYPEPRARPRVRLRMERIRRVVGVAPSWETTRDILTNLGLPPRDDDPARHALEVEVPSFRRDIAMEDDLVEEVIRVWGFDHIPSTLPGGALQLVRPPATLRQAETARRALVGAGLVEAVTYAFADPGRALALRAPGDKPPIELLNPLAQDASLLRQHPLDGLLGVVAVNVRRQQPDVRVFEVARTYVAGEHGPREPRWVAIALCGARGNGGWDVSPEPVDVYDAKGLAEHVLRAFGTEGVPGAGRLGGFEPDAHGALLAADGTVLAEFGEVAAAARAAFGIDAPVFGAAVSLDAVAAVPVPMPVYRPLPRFPSVQRDVAFMIADPELTAAAVERVIRAEAGPLLRGVSVFDVFRLPDGRRSVAWRLTFQAEDRTLTDDEVNAIHERVTRRVSNELHITLRSG